MDYKIIWSDFAVQQLEVIFEYYTQKVSSEIAQKIVLQILEQIKILGRNPFIGKKEELLSKRKEVYRCFIVSNYKIIYFVDKRNTYVKIADIIDTRQILSIKCRLMKL